ncbi:MAG TPA: hypothetical protein VFE47_16100 [Tepidisphaeraceae bacterium]|jgi:lysylphosphatidylglycerol synthetase-like protein (DUF2156 family)|nr:hypothetical protein [Tepidisphaeraceae bacterium]
MPLTYHKPDDKKPYSRAGFASLAASAISGPLGAQSERVHTVSQSLLLAIRFLPVITAILIGIATFLYLESQRCKLRGIWVVALGLLIDVIWCVMLLSSPV